MFESVELDNTISKDDYEKKFSGIRTKLFNMQQKLKAAGIPTLILLDGVPGSGRGETVNLLNEWMDSRNIRNHTFWMASDNERQRPDYWRYWRILPGKGDIGIFFGGWYSFAAAKTLKGKYKNAKFDRAMSEAREFERMLTDDGVLIIKLWLHLNEKTQAKVIRQRKEMGAVDPLAYVDKNFPKAGYGDIIKIYSKIIRLTDTANAHWYLINCQDRRSRNIAIVETLIHNMQSSLDLKNTPKQEETPIPPVASSRIKFILDTVDITKTITPADYETNLKKYQANLKDLTTKAFKKNVSTIILFEGWDAAGKGGGIRRITAAIDARIRQTIQIAAPNDEEKAHHYLWRFWQHIPKAGFVTLYDRSWYGRTLVERVEGFASVTEWSRAYQEINNFEHQLAEKGIILVKFFLHISQDEQLRRFKDRESCEWKKHKITEEDWRNREKYGDYYKAINDMFIRTSTDIAPWHIIPAEDKRYARIDALRILCSVMSKKFLSL
ncbi:MAG: polyphosphate:AMP phosphotransferase [Deferribacteraceae bacterium]|jgi:polyphosphate:AMP phosphotransferase|nr:polyphosphate:AMP phosphotransferase [Deferribacteraceae bacterium]